MHIKKAISVLIMASLLLGSCKSVSTPTEAQVTYKPIPKQSTPLQKKYGELLGVDPLTLENTKLYELIDEWIETPYLMGGDTKEGIDCSSFTQLVYTKVYQLYIERTAETQFSSEHTDKFKGQEYLKEGDLLFFTRSAKNRDKITHVGMYLANDQFVHASARKGTSGYSGVKISNLKDPYWQSRFLAAGRKMNIAQIFSSN